MPMPIMPVSCLMASGYDDIRELTFRIWQSKSSDMLMSRYGSMKTSTAHEIPLTFQKITN